jgi:hypothetical protein
MRARRPVHADLEVGAQVAVISRIPPPKSASEPGSPSS